MRFKVNDQWYTHTQFNSMMVEMSLEERDRLLGTEPTLDERENPVIRFASFVNDADKWAPENKEAWIAGKPIPQPETRIFPLEPGERTKWEKERLAKGLPIN